MVARDWADLVDGTLMRPIGRDEAGQPVQSQGAVVFTGTLAQGTANTDAGDCSGWTTASGTGEAGNFTSASSSWTAQGPAECGTSLGHIYCVEQPGPR